MLRVVEIKFKQTSNLSNPGLLEFLSSTICRLSLIVLGWFIIERVDVNFQMNIADTAVAIMCSLLHTYLE